MSSPRILIVEDDATSAALINSFLKELDYEVIAIVDSGEEAVAHAVNDPPSLVLMDISLKGKMEGVEAALKIHEELAVPIVFLTGDENDATFQRAKVTEPYGYLLKPVNKRELHTIIEIGLYRHRIEEDLRRSENDFRTLVMGIPDIVYRIDKNGYFTFISESIRELGFNPEELIGKHFSEIMPEDEYKKVGREHVLSRFKNIIHGRFICPQTF